LFPEFLIFSSHCKAQTPQLVWKDLIRNLQSNKDYADNFENKSTFISDPASKLDYYIAKAEHEIWISVLFQQGADRVSNESVEEFLDFLIAKLRFWDILQV
jgi:hypothetical protein